MWSRSGRLVTIKKTSPFLIYPNVSDQKRKAILLLTMKHSDKDYPVYKPSDVYHKPYQMILKDKQQYALALQNQVLFSPRFTSGRFKTISIFSFFVASFLLYHAFIFLPKHMMQIKKTKNVRFKQLQQKGWLDGWQQQQDRVLKLQAYSLQDLDRLQAAQILPQYKKNPKVPKQQRYISTKKQFSISNLNKV